ncbi:phage tail protein, partial [Providencia rettgeri]
MTVSTEISSNEYTGNGVTTDFDYKFRIFKANQLSVITSDADGDNVVTLRLGTDYTVTGANKSAGGKVILAKPLADGHKISIARDIPIKQETSFRNQSKFFAETHEDAFDYLTMILQRIWGSLGSLYLKRPNILANWFDAKGYRIANLGKPKRDSDAVDLGTLKDEIEGVNSTILKREKRLLRVDDMDIPALPKANERAGNVLTFDKDGKPIVVAPASGSVVDVLNQLGNGNGSLIGTEYGKTLDEVIFGRIYEGGDAAEKVREVLSRGYSPMFMNGVHKFKTTVQDGDGNDCFALVPSNTTIYTESKGVVLRPEV